jgi:TonB family protein
MSRVTVWVTLAHAVLGLLLWWWADSQGLFDGSTDALHWSSPAELLGQEGFQHSLEVKPDLSAKSQTSALAAAKSTRMKALAVTPEMLAQLSQSSATSAPVAKPTAAPLMPVPMQPPAQPATAVTTPLMDPPGNVQRTITVSQPTRSGKTSLGLLDLPQMDSPGEVDGVKMDSVDRAIIQAFKSCWTPPAGETLDPDHSSVIMDIAVNRAGRVLSFKIVQPSGHTELDDSVLQAANLLQSIGTELPKAFGKERYEPRLNFYAE